VSLLGTIGPIAWWGLFVGIAVMLGAVALRLVVLPLWRGTQPWPQAVPGADEASATLGLRAAVGLVLALLLILLDQILLFRDPLSPFWAELNLLVTATTWGRMWQLQLLSGILAMVAFWIARARREARISWRFAAATALFCAIIPALSGHSAGVDRFHVLAVGADALHVISAGAWLGTLGALVVVVRAAVKRGMVASDVLPGAVVAFSPLALLSAGTLVGTGLFATWLHVGSLGGLFGSTYGRILLVKVALVGIAAGLGAYNWRRVTPRLGSPEGAKAFMSSTARSEIAMGLFVLLLTAVLVVTAHPMER
jgi:putative copper export protein